MIVSATLIVVMIFRRTLFRLRIGSLMSIGEGKSPDDVVKVRRIRVTSENINEVAKDIQMNPTKLAKMYMNHKLANAKLFVNVRED